MRIAGIRELRAQSASLLGGTEPVLVTRHGKISGLYLPLDDPNHLPYDLRRELARVLGHHFNMLLETHGVSEETVLDDFRAHRHRCRR